MFRHNRGDNVFSQYGYDSSEVHDVQKVWTNLMNLQEILNMGFVLPFVDVFLK